MEKTKSILEKIKNVILKEEEVKAPEVTLETVETTEGTVIYAEAFAEGEAVFIEQDEERIPLPVGDYELADGRVLTVAEEGIIASVTEGEAPAEEEVVEEEMSDEDKLRQLIREVITEMQTEQMDADKEPEEEVVDDTKEQLSAISEKLDELEAKFAKMPKAEEPVPSPEGKKGLFLGSVNKAAATSKDRVMNRLYHNY